MAATAIFQHELADIHSAGSIQDTVPASDGNVLFHFAVYHPNRNVLFRIKLK
jgi:hypothetical protein